MSRYQRSLSLAVTIALTALLLMVTAIPALAWTAPQLTANCAPDENSYAFTITLAEEENYNIEMSWDDFVTAPFQTTDFESAGAHDFTTARGGTTLYVRFASDTNAKASAAANAELCEEPTTEVKLVKVDDSDVALAGVMFNLAGEGYDEDATSDLDGRAEFADVPAGEYTLTETANPFEDCETAGPWTVLVEDGGEIQPTLLEEEESGLTVTIWDKNQQEVPNERGYFKIVNTCKEKTDLELWKVDQDDKALTDVSFKLEKEYAENESGDAQTADTDEDGFASFTGLTEGEYTLTETANDNEDCETAGPWTVLIEQSDQDEGGLVISMTDADDKAVAVNEDGSFSIVNECEDEPVTRPTPTPTPSPNLPDTAVTSDGQPVSMPIAALGLLLALSLGAWAVGRRGEIGRRN